MGEGGSLVSLPPAWFTLAIVTKLALSFLTNQALSSYRKGLDYLITGLKYCKNPALKERVKEMVPSYMDRAEKIQEIINNGGKAPAPAGKKKAT